MKSLGQDRLDLIDAVLAEADTGGLTAALLEKDEHLTDALRALFAVQFEHARLVFCGGTSLSKAHRLIERMSEDADLKLVLADTTSAWSKTRLRRYLGDEVRPQILQALHATGLEEVASERRSLNDNRYQHSQWAYQRAYEGLGALRPHLQIELMARAPVLPTVMAPIGPLTDRLAGRTDSQWAVPVVDVGETVAEKVLSFLRRHALRQVGPGHPAWDRALVRHLYDVHCIVSLAPAAVDAAQRAFAALVQGDVAEFGCQHPEFAAAPRALLTQVLGQVGTDIRLRKDYDEVLLPLVHGRGLHPFDKVQATFERVAHQMLGEL